MKSLLSRIRLSLSQETISGDNVLRYKALWSLGAVVYPCWWALFTSLDPQYGQHLISYLALSSLLVVAVCLVHEDHWTEHHAPYIHAFLTWLMTTHKFYVANASGLTPNHFIGLFVAITAISSTYHSQRKILLYGAFVMSIALLLPEKTNGVSKLVLVFGLFTSIATNFLANTSRLYMIKSIRESERRLQEADAKKLDIINSIFDGFAYIDKDYNVVYANDTGLKIVGISGYDYVGKNLWSIFPDQVGSRFHEAYDQAMAGTAVEIIEFFPAVMGWIEVRAVPNSNGISLSFRNVTERIRLANEVEEQKMKAVVASKLSTLGEMAGGIAHEINNPLTIIHARAQVLKDKASSGVVTTEDIIKAVLKIDETCKRIGKIVKSLRVLARDGEHDPVDTVSVTELIAQPIEVCREKYKHHGVQLIEAGNGLSPFQSELAPTIDCRSVQVSQVILNLLANAFDSVAGTGGAWVKIETQTFNDHVEILVTDSGTGIPEGIREKMFNPFYTTKEVGKGTGLGLSISKNIIEAHGGQLVYMENEGHTCFKVTLPRVASPAQLESPVHAA